METTLLSCLRTSTQLCLSTRERTRYFAGLFSSVQQITIFLSATVRGLTRTRTHQSGHDISKQNYHRADILHSAFCSLHHLLFPGSCQGRYAPGIAVAGPGGFSRDIPFRRGRRVPPVRAGKLRDWAPYSIRLPTRRPWFPRLSCCRAIAPKRRLSRTFPSGSRLWR
jgi:hypothetical protein